MNHSRSVFVAAAAVICSAACRAGHDSTDVQRLSPQPLETPSPTTTVDLVDVKTNPANYDWFDFRPNVKKLILAGAPETQHVAILWYTVSDGTVGMHYHAKTESVYVIDGTQTDAKGVYPTGTVYFNPPGSGHQITNSSGFFILAYASPPDFASIDRIQEYTPLRFDTTASALTADAPFQEKSKGIRTFAPPLDAMGGMSAEFIELTSAGTQYEYNGNYVLILDGSCSLAGETYGSEMLLVAQSVEPQPYTLAAAGAPCLAMGVSF